jgi:hypothetical protein
VTSPKHGWPTVTEDDPGLRPRSGRQCAYCNAVIGQPHGPECVIVTKRVRFLVRAEIPNGTGDRSKLLVFIGSWLVYEPHFWDRQMSEFHKNDSTWCADGFLEDIAVQGRVKWDGPVGGVPARLLREYAYEHGCTCGALSFELDRVVDAVPKKDGSL